MARCRRILERIRQLLGNSCRKRGKFYREHGTVLVVGAELQVAFWGIDPGV